MSRQQARVSTVSTSQIITSNSAVLMGMQLGTDSLNNPTVTVYDGTDNSGNEIVPTATYKATDLGLNGLAIPYDKDAPNGIYVEISVAGGGSVEVTIDYREVN